MPRTTHLCPLAAALVLFACACDKQPAPAPAPASKPVEQTQPAAQPAPPPAAKPQPEAQPAAPASEGKVEWFVGGLAKALAEAKSSNKLVFADFTAVWCTWCAKMNREVFATQEAAAALEPVICVSIDFDKQREIADRYLVSNALPVVIWFNPDGTVRERIDDFQDKPTFLANVARIKADLGTINHLRRKVETSPSDLDQRYELYRRLQAVGEKEGAAAQRAQIEKADPQGDSRAMHHFKYDALMAEIHANWAETQALDPKQIDGLRAFLEAETDLEILWDGWMSLANTHEYFSQQAEKRGDSVEAKKERGIQRECLANAWAGIPQDDDSLHTYVTRFASYFWDVRDELSAEDKTLLLAMTETVAGRFKSDALVQDLRARALFLGGKKDEAEAACQRAIELAKQSGADPRNFEKTLEVIRGGK